MQAELALMEPTHSFGLTFNGLHDAVSHETENFTNLEG
jgi:hypothetical protein